MKRRQVQSALRFGPARRFLAGFFVVVAEFDQFRSPADHRGVLLGAVALRRQNRDRHAVRDGRERDALAVVAARRGAAPATGTAA